MKEEWTFDQPTKVGYYWIEETFNEFKIVKVRKNLFSEKLTATFLDSVASEVELAHLKGLKWAGPIFPPPTGGIKEEEFLP